MLQEWLWMNWLLNEDPRLGPLLETARKVAATDARVLISGEPGSGKTALARYLHRHSGRVQGPCIEVSCANLPQDLAESLLFGHEEGAFTGAHARHTGRLEAANEGTLVLEGIEHLLPAVQAKLLRALQEGIVEPLGCTAPHPINVRVIATTGEQPETLLKQGRLRADLYYRLSGVRLQLPALRETPEAIPALLQKRLAEENERQPGPAKRLSEDVVQRLTEHSWPGNLRELEQTITAAVILSAGEIVELEDLPDSLTLDRTQALSAAADRHWTLAELEERYIREILQRSGGNKSEAARQLGIHRKTLHRKLREFAAKRSDDD